ADAINALFSGRLFVQIPTQIRGQNGPARLKASLAAPPPSTSTATGAASLRFSADQSAVSVSLTHTIGTSTDVLIHAGPVTSNGPLIFKVAQAAGSATSPLE